MGDSECWSLKARGLSAGKARLFGEAWTELQAKGEEWWGRAERRAAEVISAIQPSPESEESRRVVVDYVRRRIKSCVNCEVVKFGSVSLKTYLPDGDIDLTLISPNPEVKRKWFDDVYHLFQREAANPNAEFSVTDVEGVPNAEVKLVKIYVEKILVDISFDHLGGVCTLCFLEEVDRLIGEDHLFKRSIILVKAWCFYESRLLSAANNLMSTYALETLVLYIFHVFHGSLRGPLQVLYLFLEFFSAFDWDKYCVSLSGPILCESFSDKPEGSSSPVVEDSQKLALTPWREGGELLFTKAFLDACERAYGGLVHKGAKAHKFAVKSLNIIDPLRSSNNLGWSVNRGNCARIRSAFAFGAKTVRRILKASEDEDISNQLNQFFKNCILGSTQRLEFDIPSPRSLQPIVSNGVLNAGGSKRDTAKSERNDDTSYSSSPRNGYHLPLSRPNHDLLADLTKLSDLKKLPSPDLNLPDLSNMLDLKKLLAQETPRQVSEFEKVYEAASGREMKAGKHKSFSAKGVDMNSRDTKTASNKHGGSNGFIPHSPHINKIAPVHIIRSCESLEPVSDVLLVAPGTCVGDECSSEMVYERNGSGCKPRVKLERLDFSGNWKANSESVEVSQRVTMANGNHEIQHQINGSASSSSRNNSEDEGGCLSQSSLKENFETMRNGLSSVLTERPVDQHSASDSVQTEAQIPSSGKHQVSRGNEEERECSASPKVDKQSGNGFEHSDSSLSKGRGRKGRPNQQNVCQSKDLEGSGICHGKPKRHSSKSRAGPFEVGSNEKTHVVPRFVVQDGSVSNVSSSTARGSRHMQSPVPASSFQHAHRPYPIAAGSGSFRHPLSNRLQFDPGTARMSGSGSGPSHASPAQHVQPYPVFQGVYHPRYPAALGQVVYNLGMNIQGNGNAKNRTGGDVNGSIAVPVENLVDSPRSRSRSKASEQQQIPVGIVERLEAEGVMACTSSRRSQTAAARSTQGADPGSSSSDFLTGDLELHLHSLAFGPSCEYTCSPGLKQILLPTYPSKAHAHKHGTWEGPGRPEAAFHAQLMAPQFYAIPQLQPFPQQRYFPAFHPSLGVGLSPRPFGTGTYIPNTHPRPNIRPSGRGQTRGAGQTTSSHHQEDRHHFNGMRQRAPPNKDQGSSTRMVENRTTKTDGARDLHHPPKHLDSPSASASHSSDPPEPSAPALPANPAEEPQPSEVIASCATIPLDVREPSPDPPEHDIPSMPESNGSPKLDDALLPFNSSTRPDLCEKCSVPELDTSASVEHSCASIASSPTSEGELTPTTTSQSVLVRTGQPTYPSWNDEDFPPLGIPRVNRPKIISRGTSGIPNVMAGVVSL